MIRLLFIFNALLTLPACSVGEDSILKVSVSGQVVNSDSGEPVKNVVIRVYEFPKWNSFFSEFKPLLSVISDESGFFSFNVKRGSSIEINSIVSVSEKTGSLYRLEKISKNVDGVVLKHRRESIGLIK